MIAELARGDRNNGARIIEGMIGKNRHRLARARRLWLAHGDRLEIGIRRPVELSIAPVRVITTGSILVCRSLSHFPFQVIKSEAI